MNINSLFNPTLALFAQAADPAAGAPPFWAQLVPFAFIIAIFYFVLIRPQMNAKKDQDALMSKARTGDKVVTSGGILGVISNVKDKTVIVKIADNVKIEVLKSHLASITSPDGKTEASPALAARN
jgi:preprotein translocase subunit YajC